MSEPKTVPVQPGYLQANFQYHVKSYTSGYGIEYPEGHVIRAYHRVLRYELGFSEADTNRTLLDFGCGNATHALFFETKNFNVYGVDSDPVSIEISKKRLPHIADRFKVIDPRPSDKDFFEGVQYDVVLANQVLYYLSDTDLSKLLSRICQQMKPNGVIIASMIASQNHRFFKQSVPAEDGLNCVKLNAREKGEFFMNFTHSKEDLVGKFNIFRPLHVGYYDTMIREDEGPGMHFLFIGIKK